jgi:hypothetical protein
MTDDIKTVTRNIIVREAITESGIVAIRNLELDDEDMGLCLIPVEHVPALIARLQQYLEDGK